MRANFGVNTLWFHGGTNWFGLFVYSAKTCAKGPRGNSIESKSPLLTKCQSFVPFVYCFLLEMLMILRTSHFWNNNRQHLSAGQNEPKIAQLWEVLFLIGLIWWMIHIVYVLKFPFWVQKMYLHRVVIGIHVFSTTEQHSTHTQANEFCGVSSGLQFSGHRPTESLLALGRIHAS